MAAQTSITLIHLAPTNVTSTLVSLTKVLGKLIAKQYSFIAMDCHRILRRCWERYGYLDLSLAGIL